VVVLAVLGLPVGVPHRSTGGWCASMDLPLRGQVALDHREPLSASLESQRLIPLNVRQGLDLFSLCFYLVNHGRDDFRYWNLYRAVRLFGVFQFFFSSPDGHGQRTTPL